MESNQFSCKDHSVTQETFSLVFDASRKLYKTEPVPENLSKYYESEAYISHTDANKGMMDRVYQVVRSITLKRKLRLINRYGIQKELLDVGCGTGDFIKRCEKGQWKTMGVEPHEGARRIAQQKCNAPIKATLEEIDHQFDIVSLWHVLEHVKDLSSYLSQLSNLVKPNGALIIAVPNFRSYDATHYGADWAAYDVPRHLWHFSQESIAKLFESTPFQLVETRGMKFDAFYVSLLSERYKFGTANPLKAFLTGLRSNLKARRSSEYSSLIYVLKKAQ